MSHRLETHPTSAQKARLESFLAQLMALCRRHDLVLQTDHAFGEISIVDAITSTIIGLDLIEQRDGCGVLTAYDAGCSILDGVWLIEHEGRNIEQRLLPPRAGT